MRFEEVISVEEMKEVSEEANEVEGEEEEESFHCELNGRIVARIAYPQHLRP